MRMKGLKSLLFVLTTVAISAMAQDYVLGSIQIKHPWSRALPDVARNGAAYMTLVNNGTTADRLISASSPIAARVGFHRHAMEDEVMRMRPLEAIEVVPGQPSVLAPGGLHIMLMGLKEPLHKDKSFALTLNFEHAGSIELLVTVRETDPSVGDGG